MKGVYPVRATGGRSSPRKASAGELQKMIGPGSSVFVESGCAEPRYLVDSLIIRNLALLDVQVFTTMPLGHYQDFGGETGDRFRIHSFFVTPGLSSPFSSGKADHIPVGSEMLERMIHEGGIKVNTALIHVTPPDEDGTVSLGVSVDVVRKVIEKADTVVAQVNSFMPFTYGESLIDISDIDYLVEHDEPLVEYAPEEHDYETRMIGQRVARLVPDGATIQFGFGRIPDAAARALGNRRGLSIVSETITNSVMELMKAGVVARAEPVAVSMCIGDAELFRFVHKNPAVSMRSLAGLCDPQDLLGRPCFVAVNGAVEIDLTGQSCMNLSERGAYLGALGQPLFHRMAQLSREGKAIIALRSTSRDTSISRIVPKFTDPRMGVFTTQSEVEYVVTEQGCVNLFGKSIRERSLELITVAHPRFRSWLLGEAKRLCYVYPDQVMPPEDAVYPAEYEHVGVFDGKEVFIRPARITDERAVQNLFYSMSNDDRFHRFLIQIKAFHHAQAQRMVNCDYRDTFAMVAEDRTGGSTQVVAVAQICKDSCGDGPQEGAACEFAVMVHPCWQGKGLGRHLLGCMVEIARRLGFKTLRMHVWEENERMLKMLSDFGFHMNAFVEYNVIRMDFDLEGVPERIADLLPGETCSMPAGPLPSPGASSIHRLN